MNPERFLYLGYYIKETDWHRLQRYVSFVSGRNGISSVGLWRDVVSSSLKYNISLLEYFNFEFYERGEDERSTFAGTGYMYEYQKLMNPVDKRQILEHKPTFHREYAPFINHKMLTLKELEEQGGKGRELLQNANGKIVLKYSKGQCGRGIEVRGADEFSVASLIQRLKQTGNDIVEEFVQQHQKLNGLSPSGLNTVRIITQLDAEDDVDILGARLRITVNSPVDNLAAGNIAAPIDLEMGRVNGPAVYSDITKEDVEKHPVTNVPIVGFRIPYWEETLEMVKQAALVNTDNRSIGWDVVVTDEGPGLIEGNHDWCKLLWQLPVKKGLKPVLEKYRKAFTAN